MEPIALLLPSLAHGGAQKVFLEMAGYLAGEGRDVVFVSLDREGELIERIPKNLDVIYLDAGLSKLRWIKRIIQWFRLQKLIEKKGVTRIISTITGMNVFTLSCFFFNKAIHVTVREANSLENNSSILMLFLIQWLYPRANRVICTSNYVRDQLLQFSKFKSNKVEMLPNPVDMKRIRVCATEPYEYSKVIPLAGYRIVTIGRLVKQKGFDVLLEALAISRKREDIYLVIVGDGPEKSNLEAIIHRLGLSDAVCLAGYQSNPFPYIANSDLFVLSSRWEGYVNVVIEAMVLGIDIVATDCKSGPGDLLKNKLNYSLVPIESSEALAHAIVDSLLNPRDTSKFNGLLKQHQLPYAVSRYLGEEHVK